MELVRRIYNFLRSRKLAFWLIAAFVLYAAVATSLSKDDWGRAYANPLFILIATALALSTAACAWERTAAAVRLWRIGTATTPAFVKHLESDPQIAVPVPAGADTDAVMDRAASSLRKRHLRVRSGGGRLAAASTRISLLGSPIFHWSLVLLFVVVGAGRLTRAEGLIGVPVGGERLDTAASYGQLQEGPLHDSDFTGLTIRVPEMELAFFADGVDRGEAPVVELWKDGERVARHRVYPNSPLRYGSVMVHPSTYGLASRFALRGGAEDSVSEVLYDFTTEVPRALNTAPLQFVRGDQNVTLVSSVPLDRVGNTAPWALPAAPQVDWELEDGGVVTTGTVAVGQSIDLGDGATLTLEDVTYYARISFVDDWSVYPIYAIFIIGMVGLAIALLLPPKSAWVMLVERDGTAALHARTRQGRTDRLFPARVEAALRSAVESEVEQS